VSWLERHRSLLIVGLLVALFIGAIVLLVRAPAASGVEIVLPPPTDTPLPSPTPSPSSTPAPLRVYVAGAVLHPDVYTLPPGSIVKDALVAAGGPTEQADLVGINLALELRDQTQIVVPTRGAMAAAPVVSTPPVISTPPAPPASTPAGRPGQGSGLININAASQAELESLPGIGPTLAQRIIEHRPYKSVQELLNVPGIGQTTLDRLRDLVTLR
jgi:competence protein ComEA